MAVLNSSHRQAILNKARTTTASTGTVDFDDFDNLLGDLSSAIADLESITAVSVFVCVCDLFCLHNSLLCSLFNLSSSPCLPPSLLQPGRSPSLATSSFNPATYDPSSRVSDSIFLSLSSLLSPSLSLFRGTLFLQQLLVHSVALLQGIVLH